MSSFLFEDALFAIPDGDAHVLASITPDPTAVTGVIPCLIFCLFDF
jgi:hypothetical protein